MHKATRKEIKDLNEGAVCIDHSKISVTYRHEVNTAEALNVSAENFGIICVVFNSSTQTNYTQHENVYLLATKVYSIRYSRRRSSLFSETKNCQLTFVPNADLHYCCVVIV
jgi:hypothetical protein